MSYTHTQQTMWLGVCSEVKTKFVTQLQNQKEKRLIEVSIAACPCNGDKWIMYSRTESMENVARESA